MAEKAFLYLFVSNGVWCQDLQGLIAIITFLNDRMNRLPTKFELRELRRILSLRPITLADFEDWFDDTYPKNARPL